VTKLGAPERHAPPDSLFSAFTPLLALMLATFAGIFASGMTLPVVPQHVHDTLGQGTVMVGLVMEVRSGRSSWRWGWCGKLDCGVESLPDVRNVPCRPRQ
jgi:hypothetical protein